MTGRQGEVADGELETLLDGAGLRRSPGDQAIAGFDLTFRPPKSVSVLWAVAGDVVALEVREAHDAAVRDAMNYLEREACKARRGRDGVLQVEGGGFVAAAFRHRTSRAEDPLLHTHVVVGNLTSGPDGRWTALDGRHLYRHAKAAGCLYQAVLRAEMSERLGVRWTPVRAGTAEIAGVRREVIEHFSRRRRAILDELGRRGLSSAKAAQVATLDTRPAKAPPRSNGRLREEWRSRAAELGLDRASLGALLDREQLEDRTPGVDIEQLTAHDSTFGRPELVEKAASSFTAGASAREVVALSDQLGTRPEVVGVGRRPAQAGLVEPRYSTEKLLAAERSLMRIADGRDSTPATAVPTERIEAAIAAAPRLGEDQQAMVRDVCGEPAAVQVVKAPAGTGKTFAMSVCREAWEASDIPVLGCALSARAAEELNAQTQIPTSTVAAMTRGFERGYAIPHGGVLVVDEAGMIGTRDLAALANEAARSEAKLLLVGDDRQLPEIAAGGAFGAVARRVDVIELREVHRQRDAWDRDALSDLRSGEIERFAEVYVEHERIVVAEDAAAARERLVEDWWHAREPGRDSVMLALRRSDVAELNDRVREKLRDAGELKGPDVNYGDRSFALGDRVITTRNDRVAGAINGRRGTVTDARDGWLSIEHDGPDAGHVLLFGDQVADSVEHAYAMTVHRAQGATVDRSYVLADDTAYREWAYTALSRHRDSASLYVAADTLAGDVEHPDTGIADGLSRLLGQSRAKALAVEPDPVSAAEQLGLEPDPRDMGMVEAPGLDLGMGW